MGLERDGLEDTPCEIRLDWEWDGIRGNHLHGRTGGNGYLSEG